MILTPSAEYARQAGARIRYGRMMAALDDACIRCVLRPIGEFDPLDDDFDAVLVSKCHDARAVLAAVCLGRRGVPVGVDLFDDYFSQSEDPRLSRYRTWFGQMMATCAFALCSTPAMEAIVREHGPGLPVLVMNDPGTALPSPGAFADMLDRKVRRALDTRTVEMCWFGRGSNPNFPVGLADLAAFGPELLALSTAGFAVRLTVLTNADALTPDAVEAIRCLPAEIVFEDWDETREADVLARSLVAFLPVNAQRFSAAKSLNRAVSALQAGCQVLTPGFPLYRRLAPFIYADTGDLVRDLDAGSLLLSRPNCAELFAMLDDVASAETEAGRLSGFLATQCTNAKSAGEAEPAMVALLHGAVSNKAVNAFAIRTGALAVASVFAASEIDADVRFVLSAPGAEPALLISNTALDRLVPGLKARMRPCGAPWRGYWTDAEADPIAVGLPAGWTLGSYGSAMADAERRLREAFGPFVPIVSELSPLPLQPGASQLARPA